jgi:hypothetical protein
VDNGALMMMRTSRSILMLLVAVATLTASQKNAVGLLDDPPRAMEPTSSSSTSVNSPQVNFYVNDKRSPRSARRAAICSTTPIGSSA